MVLAILNKTPLSRLFTANRQLKSHQPSRRSRTCHCSFPGPMSSLVFFFLFFFYILICHSVGLVFSLSIRAVFFSAFSFFTQMNY